ncbi:hypothetical protein F183_A31140 [Bryobacterales bacterium F-183]|nr:hypothetical protein F183_A31140 [Bryobacterales bacterium F-183]
MSRWLTGVSALVLAPVVVYGQFHTTLKPKTTAAFEQYRNQVEASLTGKARFAQLRAGETKVEPAGSQGSIDVAGGMVHDWVAATVVPNTSAAQVIAVLQDYAAYKNVYGPEVADSRLIERKDGNRFRVFLKLVKSKILTAVLHSEYDVEYQDRGAAGWRVISRSTRMVEVGNQGKELAPGEGHGFLWRLNAYWLIEPRGSDVYVECRTVSLSRDIPFGAGFVIRPFVTSLPVESLKQTLDQTVRAIRPAKQP